MLSLGRQTEVSITACAYRTAEVSSSVADSISRPSVGSFLSSVRKLEGVSDSELGCNSRSKDGVMILAPGSFQRVSISI